MGTLGKQRRTLICAPTNHTIRQVSTCVLNLAKSSPNVSVEGVILFGNREGLGIRGDVEEIFLENKVGALKKLQAFDFQEENTITKICLERASLVMCTTSHSYNLHNLQNELFQFLVIDEAAQLKEAEFTIPLQLPGIMHVVLVGDECQLSAMVTSDMSAKWEFGRSLFVRLSLLGHPKKLLNV
ncbi:putative P-loop containing nucleoside triphosphate hydrolase, DNA2/NAM7 helicase, helicase [Helianthus annuus]|nr:putative P-loop containing nucleoside triphosphate hydrolase, DNA2/NAM7 helicase, helicase [Helianthus annuus]